MAREAIRKFPSVELMGAAAQAAEKAAGLRLLVLHGSRARGDARGDSDWDLAFLADSTFDPDDLLARLGEELATDQLDLADLSRASALLRFKTASEGVPLYEREPGLFDRFQLEAVSTWCDMEPVLTRAYDAQLARQTT